MAHRASLSLVLCVAVLALGAATCLSAQTLLGELTAVGPFGSIGDRVATAGDVDGDGVPDLLVAGRVGVFTFSGATGQRLSFHDVDTAADDEPLRNLRGLPDVDGDGQPDFAIVTRGDFREEVHVFSRGSGALLWTFMTSPSAGLGANLALISDLDGDGLDDLVVSRELASPNGISQAGSIHVLSLATGAPLARIDGTLPNQQIGSALTVLRDLDGDGVDEIAFGDPTFEVAGVRVGRVLVVNALTGSQIASLPMPTAQLTHSSPRGLVNLGDVDGDGLDDVAAFWVAPLNRFISTFSAATGALLWTVPSIDFGGQDQFINVGDVDLDGIDDLAAARQVFQPTETRASVLSGGNGATIRTLVIPYNGIHLEIAGFEQIAATGDLDGDGVPDLISTVEPVGSSGEPSYGRVFSLADASTLHVLGNSQGNHFLGQALALGDDRDGDGQRDWILLGHGSVVHFSGATGEQLADFPFPATEISIPGWNPDTGLHTAVAGLPDTNGDGVPDFVVGYGLVAPANAGALYRVSGADGSILAQRGGGSAQSMLGSSIAPAHDADGDGVPDLWVSAPRRAVSGTNGAGQVELVSGLTLAPLLTLDGSLQLEGRFGSSLSSGADLDLDGVLDLAIGSEENAPGLPKSGPVSIRSGADGSEILRIDGAANTGVSLAVLVGDANADGVPDVLMSEPSFFAPGLPAIGRVRMISGATGATLWTRTGAVAHERFGARVGGVGDVNGDGLPDVIAASFPSGLGTFFTVLSGSDGAVLDAFDPHPGPGLPAGVEFFPAFASAGLVDVGGCGDFLVGLPWLDGNGGARLYASSQGGDWGFVDLGHGLAGSAPVPPRLSLWGDLQGGGSVSFALRGALPHVFASWFLSVGATHVPFKGGTLVPSPFTAFFVGVVPTDAQGEIVVLDIPTPLGIPQGVSLWHQFATQDPLAPVGVALSNAVQEIFKGD